MNILISYHGDYFNGFVDEIESYLKLKGHKTVKIDRECLDESFYKKIDLIVVIGGDGTFLRTSHYNSNIPMLGINPNPEKKEGFFMQLNKSNYKERLQKILKSVKTIDYYRLQVKINSVLLDEQVLNEVYIGSEKPYLMFNYDIAIGKNRELQRSSGILVGTPAGSHAWIKSAGGKVQKLTEKKFQYLIREPYEGKITGKFRFKKGIFEDRLIIIPKSPGILVIDSVGQAYTINPDSIIEIFPGKKLNYVKV